MQTPATPVERSRPRKAAGRARPSAKAPERRPPWAANSQEAALIRISQVRARQREEGNFDCFAKAQNGFCDQHGCLFHSECLSISLLVQPL
jgi:hypothetical protein